MTPGDLGRAALHCDPRRTAENLRQWCANDDELDKVRDWFADVVCALDDAESPRNTDELCPHGIAEAECDECYAFWAQAGKSFRADELT